MRRNAPTATGRGYQTVGVSDHAFARRSMHAPKDVLVAALIETCNYISTNINYKAEFLVHQVLTEEAYSLVDLADGPLTFNTPENEVQLP